MESRRSLGSTFKLITPNDNAGLGYVGYVRVGGAGDLKVVTADGETVVVPSMNAGEVFLTGVTKVFATGTTATSLGAYL